MPTVRTRVDACPGVVSPHLAADGALARIRLPGGVIGAAALRAVADLADDAGDGAVHLTSRGNLQLRGLNPDDSRPVRRLDEAGLLPSRTHERVRNVLASPLSGVDGGIADGGVADVRGLSAALDRGLCARPDLAALPGRFLFAFDDGRGDVTAERPDVCWSAVSADEGELLVAGVPTGLRCSATDAPRLLLDAASEFLRLSHADAAGSGPVCAGEAGAVAARPAPEGAVSNGGVSTGTDGVGNGPPERTATRAWRAVEMPDAATRITTALLAESPDPTASERVRPALRRPDVTPDLDATNPAVGFGAPDSRNVTADPATAVDHHVPASLSGVHAPDPAAPGRRSSRFGPSEGGNVLIGRRGNAVGVAPVLGELSSTEVRLLADLAPEVVVTPWRSLVLPAPHDPDDAERTLREAGLVVDPGHPATRVSACAGMPGCAKSLADVRAHARSLISHGAGRVTHVSGCARRCGAPHSSHVDLVATGPDTYEEGSR